MPADSSQIPLFSSTAALPSILANYRPLPGIRDEIITDNREIRGHWAPLIEAFNRMGPSEVERRFGFADRHLRDTGVVHRIYDALGGSEKPLPLAHVPLLIAEAEWTEIEAGVIQRAELINRVLADIYGGQRLIKDGQLPATLIAGSPEFLRPMVGVTPAGGSHLLVYGADIGRAPDGHWQVLSDRTQAPAGAGYTVENRIALSRALPELYQPMHVRRLAGYFGALRDHLNGLSPAGHKVGVLSQGAYNESAFEHAYLARYLGFLLLEGEDLVVRDNRVFASTINGLQPVDVLLRRMDAKFADPLAFNAKSIIGTPGLALAAQAGTVTLANALGSGVAETPGIMAYLPQLARIVLGTDLKLPNIGTRWCGHAEQRDAVLADFNEQVIAPAFGSGVAGILDSGAVQISEVTESRREQISNAIAARGIDFIAQEAVHLSTMPVWKQSRLEPHPFVLRVFAARIGSGWQVMPGGFCQVGSSVDPRAISLQRGSSVSDVWVMSERPAAQLTLLPTESSPRSHKARDVLPTRTAENLFWLGRYIERAENATRISRALASRVMELDSNSDAMIPFLVGLLNEAGALDRKTADSAAPENAIICALADPDAIGGVCRLVSRAQACAAKTRDQLSADAWTILSDLTARLDRAHAPIGALQDILEHCNWILRQMSAFAGLANNNMTRLSGWDFLQLGGRIERAINIAWLSRALCDDTAPAGGFEALLEIADSQINFGTLYSNAPTRPQVVDLVVLDHHNPRSLAYQTRRIDEHMKDLPDPSSNTGPSPSRRISITVAAEVDVLAPGEVTNEVLRRIVADLASLSDAITTDFFIHWNFASTGQDM